VPYEHNPRLNEQAVPAVMESIKQCSYVNDIIVDEENVILAGHTRLKALRQLGYADVDVCRVTGLTPEQKRKYRLLDNRTAELSEWDTDLLPAELDGLNFDGFDFGFDAELADGAGNTERTQGESLIDRFVVPPFSVLDARQGYWQERKRFWIDKGIASQEGRADALLGKGLLDLAVKTGANLSGTSVFDPVLCEIMYRWFCPQGGRVLDCFAGGSVRGVIAAMLGHAYTGIDLRAEQIEANRRSAEKLGVNPVWHCDDSLNLDRHVEDDTVDLVFSCPPYGDLEQYSDNPHDLSTMAYPDFLDAYRKIVALSCKKLRENRFAVFVVGDIRDRDGFYRDFIADTNRAFAVCGMKLYNQFILVEQVATAAVRAGRQFNAMRKACKTHQNVQVFYKGDPQAIKTHYTPLDFDSLSGGSP
jgi:hypothetical protein